MTKIYTSYFAGIKKFNIPEDNCMSIAVYSPRGVKIKSFPKLFPTPSILRAYKNRVIDDLEYERKYRNEVLSKLNPAEVAQTLNEKVLICYEKSSDFCHRHIVAKWLEENGCAIVEEIDELFPK